MKSIKFGLVLFLSVLLISTAANAFSFNFKIFHRKPIITGGVPSVSGGYTTRTFTSGNNLVVSGSSISVEYIIIGGGGGGGNGQDGLPASGGSGGGAGQGLVGNMVLAPGTFGVIVGGSAGSVSVGNPSSLNGVIANGGSSGVTAGQGGSWTTGGVGGSVPIAIYGGTGGAGGAGRSSPGQVGDNGGAGTVYGAGGGGAGAGYNFHGVGGSGAQGIVVIKYLTSAAQ